MPLLDEMLNLTKAEHGPDHPDTHLCMAQLGNCYYSLKRLDKSVPLFEELLPRLADIRLDGPVARLRSNFVSGIKRLPVRVVWA